jgi:hypothetical protein
MKTTYGFIGSFMAASVKRRRRPARRSSTTEARVAVGDEKASTPNRWRLFASSGLLVCGDQFGMSLRHVGLVLVLNGESRTDTGGYFEEFVACALILVTMSKTLDESALEGCVVSARMVAMEAGLWRSGRTGTSPWAETLG